MKKRGQITVFVIIGLILLVSISIAVYLTTQRAVTPVEEEIIVPEDARPVHEFVQGCVRDISREGIGMLGLQGGFIDLPGIIERTPTAYIPIDSFGAFKVPLWYYENEDRTPSVKFMEREISRYVARGLRQCTGGFEVFEGRFRVEEEGNISVSTVIADDDVLVRISWPLALTTLDRTTRIQDFVTRMDVRLREMWNLANQTLRAENEQAFFEQATIDFMAADTENIPTDGFTLECGVKRWRLPEIQERLERILYYQIPTTRVRNTEHFPFSASERTYERLKSEEERMTRELEQGRELTPPRTEAPDDAYQYFKMYFDIGLQRPTDLTTGFEYHPEWGMLLSAQPSEGTLLKSNTGKGAGKFLRFLCMNQWHFAYDIIYPIKASIRDDEAFGGEGFVFQYAFPVLINNNGPERLDFNLRRFESVDYGAPEFCTTYGNEQAEIRAFGELEGVPVLMELPDVRIQYKCFNQECDLGKTKAEGGIYRLTTYLPRGCTNPFITASKDGYLSETQQLLTNRLDLELVKLQEMDLEFIVHPYFGQDQTWGSPRPLKENEQVALQVSLVNTTFDQFAGYATLNETLQFALDDAHYNIDAMLYLRDNQIGGYNAQNLEIKYDEVIGATTATMHVIEYLPVPVKDEQKIDMITFIMDGEYQNALRPEFE